MSAMTKELMSLAQNRIHEILAPPIIKSGPEAHLKCHCHILQSYTRGHSAMVLNITRFLVQTCYLKSTSALLLLY